MKKINGLLIALAIILTASSCKEEYPDAKDGIYAEIVTTHGTMFAELYYEATPATVANFVALAEGTHPEVNDSLKGKPFYDGLIFHRVIDGFMIQGGDFTGTGSGQLGYQFDQEIVDTLKHDAKGVLSMANAGPNTNGSQFFIMDEPNPNLDGGYNVFGKVIEGLAVVDSIATVETGPADRPVDSVVMKKVRIIRKGKEAKKWDAPEVFKEQQKIAEERRVNEEKLAEERREAAPAIREAKAAELAALKEKARKLPSGVSIYMVKKGSGEKPAIGTNVLLDYSGYLENGTLFDSSDLETALLFDAVNPNKQRANAYRSMPVEYSPEVGMIPGFREALLSMEYGDQIVAFIPSELAYGANGGGPIPPNSNLIFEMKMAERE
ncbi:peptidylprolyl isomerase [Nonlabens marinus]|uniref:peptidylprolyl isomerase n=1 Tax=Nonlabens marinus S1-08 TaxID=1454201 RepID=W8VSJ9_9FLAO|nr:peptidylprolyl isomerase [Nonlabens marinus]BAO56265.1 peptidyl-prolyl cis-trans isomerase [Nonlabens marinus S1-08]